MRKENTRRLYSEMRDAALRRAPDDVPTWCHGEVHFAERPAAGAEPHCFVFAPSGVWVRWIDVCRVLGPSVEAAIAPPGCWLSTLRHRAPVFGFAAADFQLQRGRRGRPAVCCALPVWQKLWRSFCPNPDWLSTGEALIQEAQAAFERDGVPVRRRYSARHAQT